MNDTNTCIAQDSSDDMPTIDRTFCPKKEDIRMSPTKHAQIRFQQRGLRGLLIDIVMTYGRVENAPGGAMKVFFGRKEKQNAFQEIKGLMRMIDKAAGGTLILKDNAIITGYKTK